MTTMAPRSSQQFIMIPCRCGRVLRAKWEQVGSEIQCWDCQATVRVTIPQDRTRIVGRMARSVGTLFLGEGSGKIAVGAIILTVGLLVPALGLVLAAAFLVLGAAVYVDIVQTQHDEDRYFEVNWDDIRRRLTPTRGIMSLALALGTVVPLWVVGLGNRRSPHLGLLGAGLLAACWLVVPVALVVLARPSDATAGTDQVSLREGFRTILRYPFITIGVLLIVPLGMVLCESALGGLSYAAGSLPTMALDYMPKRGQVQYINGYVLCNGIFYPDVPARRFVGDYLNGLRQGYSFVGAIPPSFSVSSRWGVNPECIFWTRELYGLARIGAVLMTCLTLVMGFAIQARCLSVLAHARRRGTS